MKNVRMRNETSEDMLFLRSKEDPKTAKCVGPRHRRESASSKEDKQVAWTKVEWLQLTARLHIELVKTLLKL